MSLYKTLCGVGLATFLAFNTGNAIAQEKEKEEQVVEQEVIQEKKEEQVVQEKKEEKKKEEKQIIPEKKDPCKQKEEKRPQNIISSIYPELSAVGYDGFLTNYFHHISTKPGSKINLREMLGLSAKEENVSYKVIEINSGLKNYISYLKKGLECRDEQSKKEKLAAIKHLEELRNKIAKGDFGGDRESISKLEEYVKDGFVDVEGVRDGLYLLRAESEERDGYAKNSIPIIVNIRHEPEKQYVEETKEPVEQEIIEPKETKIIKPGEKDIVECVEITGARKKGEKIKKPLSTRLIVDGFYGKDGLKGGGVGVGYGPFSVLMNYSTRDDKIVEEVISDLSAGRTGVGSVRDTNFNSLGAALELYFKPFFVGTGVNLWNYTRPIEESIISATGEVIKSNTNSKSEREILGRFYAGVEVPVSKNFGLRAMVGYDSGERFEKGNVWGGVGGCFKFGNKRLYKK